MDYETIRATLPQLDDSEIEQLAMLVKVELRRRCEEHRSELTQTLDDRDHRNWIEQDDVIDTLGKRGGSQNKELLAFLLSLGENDNLRGEFVEKDNKGRNIEVAIVGGHAVYFHLDTEAHTVRILRIVPA